MASQRKILATLRLTGERFEGAGMAAGSASEISTVNDIINELVESFWRQDHPERERLSKNFRGLNELRFTHLVEGSAVIALEAPSIETDDQDALLEPVTTEYIRKAVNAFEAYIRAVAEGEEIPNLIHKIDPTPVKRLGATLGNGEALQARQGNGLYDSWDGYPKYTSATREAVLYELKSTQQQEVTYQGLIRGTDLTSKTFTFSDVDSGTKVKASYIGHPDFKLSVEGEDELAAIWVKVSGAVEFSREGGQHVFSHVKSLWTESLTPRLKDLYDELASYLNLEKGWVDDECGEKVCSSAVENAREVILASAACNELPTAMSPTVNGGVNLSWIEGDTDFSVELYPGGEITFHKANVSTGAYKADNFISIPGNLSAQLHAWIKENTFDD